MDFNYPILFDISDKERCMKHASDFSEAAYNLYNYSEGKDYNSSLLSKLGCLILDASGRMFRKIKRYEELVHFFSDIIYRDGERSIEEIANTYSIQTRRIGFDLADIRKLSRQRLEELTNFCIRISAKCTKTSRELN